MVEGSRSGQTSRTSLCIRIPAPYTMRKGAGLETGHAWLCFPQQAASLYFPPLRPPLMRVRGREVSEKVTYCALMVKRRPSEQTISLQGTAAGCRTPAILPPPTLPLPPPPPLPLLSQRTITTPHSWGSTLDSVGRKRKRGAGIKGEYFLSDFMYLLCCL